MKKLVLTICALFAISYANAQEEPEKEKKHALSIDVGTGVGISYSYKMNNYFSLTAKYGVLTYKQEDFEYEIDGEDVFVNAEFDFSHADVMLSIAPFGKAFRLVAGAGYFMSSTVDVDMTFTESVFIGDVEFTSDDVGQIAISTEWGQILPYVGIGLGRAVPKTGFGFGLEIGAYYDAEGPLVSLDATGLIENTKDQETLVQEAFSDSKFIPNLSLRLAYSF